MKEKFGEFFALFGAAVAAACCLGIPVVLSAMGAVGLGFLVHDAYLFPIFVGFISLSLWTLYRSAGKHEAVSPVATLPFWLGCAGALISSVGLWFTVTGRVPLNGLVYLGLGFFVAATVWDFIIGRQTARCADAVCEPAPAEEEKIDRERRVMTGAALSVAAAGVFYGLYKSVEAYAPEAEEGEIACWGINACKGTTACSTAFNACNGQNECRGRGYIYVPEKECFARGGESLEGSAADPKRS
ncbi:MAG: MerC domain-containing protein [Pseudomonadota bacterium]